MGIFKSKYARGGEGSSNTLNAFLGSGTEYRGRLEFVGTVRIDGVFHGEITADGSLVLGKDALFKGQIHVATLISNGRIEGDVVVRSKATLQKFAVLEGSLKTEALVVEEGATIEGTVEMSKRRGEGDEDARALEESSAGTGWGGREEAESASADESESEAQAVRVS